MLLTAQSNCALKLTRVWDPVLIAAAISHIYFRNLKQHEVKTTGPIQIM